MHTQEKKSSKWSNACSSLSNLASTTRARIAFWNGSSLWRARIRWNKTSQFSCLRDLWFSTRCSLTSLQCLQQVLCTWRASFALVKSLGQTGWPPSLLYRKRLCADVRKTFMKWSCLGTSMSQINSVLSSINSHPQSMVEFRPKYSRERSKKS